MKLVNNTLYLEMTDLEQAGLNSKTFIEAKAKGRKYLRFIDDPADLRKSLVEYNCLKQADQAKIIERFGNPIEYLAQQPLRQLIKKDIKAERYYQEYTFENGSRLPIDHVNKYSKAAAFLNMLLAVEKDKQLIKSIGIKMTSFYENAVEIIKADSIDLPTSYRNLLPKMKAYKNGSYDSLIEKWRFNNNYAQKVKDDLSQAMLLELIADDSKHDDVMIARIYNRWANEKAYKQITDATVGNWRRDNEADILAARSGNKEWYNKYGKQILRKRPSAPLLMIGGDGNDWDMFFQGPKGNIQTYYFNKYTLVVVIDAFNDYVLGWSISEANGNETAELIKAAYIDALLHIKEKTGNYYLPHQLQSDRFAQKELLPFFQKMDDKFFYAAARAPRGKYIERSFGTLWHQILRQYKNYSGNNVKAHTGINPERIDREKSMFPHTSEAFTYAQNFIQQLRCLQDDKGISKEQQWLDAFASSDLCKQKYLSEEQFLLNFGTVNTRTQTITNRGLNVQIANTEYLYTIPETYYMDTVGKKVSIIFNPYDFQRVLVTDGHKTRFIAATAEYLPSAKADATEADNARFFARLHNKKMHMQRIAQKKQTREMVLMANGTSARAELQAGVLDKNLKHSAMLHYTEQEYQPNIYGGDVDPLEQM